MTGSIEFVEEQAYDHLVASYVERVSQLPGVQGVVKFGSVTAPGLSDIDLVVTITDDGPVPQWEQLSLLRHSEGHPARSVVAHDVFVWPESVARNAEAFFYVDQQTVLCGDRLGGEIDSAVCDELRDLIVMDYLIHRFESLAVLLVAPTANLRSVLLFISTLRHSCRLAADIGVMSLDTCELVIADILELRLAALTQSVSQDQLDTWPARLVEILWQLAIGLGQRLGLKSEAATRRWSPSSRQVFVNCESEDGVRSWQEYISAQLNRWPSRYVRAAPVPSITYSHVRQYFQEDSDSADFMMQQLPQIFGRTPVKFAGAADAARRLRAEAVIEHWKFVQSRGYTASSGIGYLGVATPLNQTNRSRLLNRLARLNAWWLSSIRLSVS